VSSSTSGPVWSVRIVAPGPDAEPQAAREVEADTTTSTQQSIPIESTAEAAGAAKPQEDVDESDKPRPPIEMPYEGSDEKEPPPKPPIEMTHEGSDEKEPPAKPPIEMPYEGSIEAEPASERPIEVPPEEADSKPEQKPPIEMPYDGADAAALEPRKPIELPSGESAGPAQSAADETTPTVDEIGAIPVSDEDAERIEEVEKEPAGEAPVKEDIEELGDEKKVEEILPDHDEDEEPSKPSRTDDPIPVRPRMTARSTSSAFPWIITAIIAVGLIAFVTWWLIETRSVLEPRTTRQAPPPARPPAQTTQPEEVAQEDPAGTEAVVDETANDDAGETEQVAEPVTTDPEPVVQEEMPPPAQTIPPPQPAAPQIASTPPATDSTRDLLLTEFQSTAPGADNITVINTLESFSGMFFVHVFSFQTLQATASDAEYLAGRGYKVVIAPADLGSRGMWYRVYVGPLPGQREARRTKIRLDENPRVKSTRVEKVPN